MTGALTNNRSEPTNKNKSFIIIVQPQRIILSMIMSFINDSELERNLNFNDRTINDRRILVENRP